MSDALVTALSQMIEDRLIDVHTALVGKIQSYSAATQLADVELLIRVNGEKIPVLPKIPVAWPRTAGTFIHLPMTAGDFVTVLFCEESINVWRAKGGALTAPGDSRRHPLTGAIAFPGGYPDASKFTVTEPTKIVIHCASGVKIEGDLAIQGDLSVTGAITAGGEITAKSGTPAAVKLSTHTHATGVGPSGPPTPGT